MASSPYQAFLTQMLGQAQQAKPDQFLTMLARKVAKMDISDIKEVTESQGSAVAEYEKARLEWEKAKTESEKRYWEKEIPAWEKSKEAALAPWRADQTTYGATLKQIGESEKQWQDQIDAIDKRFTDAYTPWQEYNDRYAANLGKEQVYVPDPFGGSFGLWVWQDMAQPGPRPERDPYPGRPANIYPSQVPYPVIPNRPVMQVPDAPNFSYEGDQGTYGAKSQKYQRMIDVLSGTGASKSPYQALMGQTQDPAIQQASADPYLQLIQGKETKAEMEGKRTENETMNAASKVFGDLMQSYSGQRNIADATYMTPDEPGVAPLMESAYSEWLANQKFAGKDYGNRSTEYGRLIGEQQSKNNWWEILARDRAAWEQPPPFLPPPNAMLGPLPAEAVWAQAPTPPTTQAAPYFKFLSSFR